MEQVRLKRLVSRINVKSQTPNSESHIDLEDIQSWTGKQAPHVGDIETDQTTFQQGDVLFGKLRPYLAKVVRPLFDGTCSSELLVLRPGERVETNFLFYTAIDKKFIDLVDSSTYGAKMPRASWEFIGQIPVNTPSLEQQNAIGEFLDSKTTQIDNLISKKQRQIKLLKEKRSAIITEAVTKGVDPTVKMKDSGVKWLGEMPEHWELIRVKRAGTIRYGLGQPPNELDEGLPLIRATDLHAGFIDTQTMLYVDPDDIPWSKNPLLHVGEIIIVRSGAYTGDSAIIPETLEGSIAGYDMVVTPTTLNPLFLSYYFLSDFFLLWQLKPETLRAAQPHLNAEELGSFLVLRPPFDEQVKIGQWLENKLSQIKNLTEQISNSIELLIELRSSLISEAVTGKLSIGETS